jgi:hypothetical protein
MTIAVTSVGSYPASPTIPGDHRERHAKVAFDTNYPSGGYPITAASFGLTTLDDVRVAGATKLGRLAAWDATNSKIIVYKAVLTENDVADLSLDSVHVTVYGR